jgi:hypothetical protein
MLTRSRLVLSTIVLPLALSACSKNENKGPEADPNTMQALAAQTKCPIPPALVHTGVPVDNQTPFANRNGRYILKNVTTYQVAELKASDGTMYRGAIHTTANSTFPTPSEEQIPLITECLDSEKLNLNSSLEAANVIEAPTRKVVSKMSMSRSYFFGFAGEIQLRITPSLRPEYFGDQAAPQVSDPETTGSSDILLQSNGDLVTFTAFQKLSADGRLFVVHKITYGFVANN